MSIEHKEQPLPEPQGDANVPFSWGVRKGSINLYESFTLQGVEYFLYDIVCIRRDDQIDIGKLVKILEMENHEKKVEVVWFFRPMEIVNCLGDVKPLQGEIFLACGEGKGLSNVNPLVTCFYFVDISDNLSHTIAIAFITLCFPNGHTGSNCWEIQYCLHIEGPKKPSTN